jgi:hypothetical protein
MDEALRIVDQQHSPTECFWPASSTYLHKHAFRHPHFQDGRHLLLAAMKYGTSKEGVAEESDYWSNLGTKRSIWTPCLVKTRVPAAGIFRLSACLFVISKEGLELI